ncbi:(2Fe-2S)-binding protein, partial [Patescibacteria group bacterium]|nr:(2Fe-2S)-binding protein [Patescibacteria group bacterium]
MIKSKRIHPVKSCEAGSPTAKFNRVKIIINGKRIQAFEGQTVFQVAKKHGIEIPAFCYHSDLEIKSNCCICVVKIKGIKDLQTSCSTKVKPGMEVMTDTPRIKRVRRINLELILAQHFEECNDCVWTARCQLLRLAKRHRLKTNRFVDRKKDFSVYQFGKSLIFDSSKCIDCYNCVEMCEKQGVGFLEMKNRGVHTKIVPTKDKNKDCIYCGQCIVHCPAGAFEAVGEFEEIEKPFHPVRKSDSTESSVSKNQSTEDIFSNGVQQKDKLVVVQFAPSIRTSIGEEFNIPLGMPITEKLAAGIKKLGVEKVFDV